MTFGKYQFNISVLSALAITFEPGGRHLLTKSVPHKWSLLPIIIIMQRGHAVFLFPPALLLLLLLLLLLPCKMKLNQLPIFRVKLTWFFGCAPPLRFPFHPFASLPLARSKQIAALLEFHFNWPQTNESWTQEILLVIARSCLRIVELVCWWQLP